MTVVQLRYGEDNLGYLIHGEEHAIAVDGGAVDEILLYLGQNKLQLKYVTNTHTHGDHTCGNRELLRQSNAEFLDVKELPEAGIISLENNIINVIHTPGHTADSVCFQFDDVLLSGDTIFNGKIGRCFTGDIHSFYLSIKKILELPDATVVYAGHDYVLEYLKTAKELDPANPFISDYRKAYSPDLVKSTLGEEKRIDPFIRFNEPEMIELLKSRNLPVDTEFHRFSSILSLI